MSKYLRQIFKFSILIPLFSGCSTKDINIAYSYQKQEKKLYIKRFNYVTKGEAFIYDFLLQFSGATGIALGLYYPLLFIPISVGFYYGISNKEYLIGKDIEDITDSLEIAQLNQINKLLSEAKLSYSSLQELIIESNNYNMNIILFYDNRIIIKAVNNDKTYLYQSANGEQNSLKDLIENFYIGFNEFLKKQENSK